MVTGVTLADKGVDVRACGWYGCACVWLVWMCVRVVGMGVGACG